MPNEPEVFALQERVDKHWKTIKRWYHPQPLQDMVEKDQGADSKLEYRIQEIHDDRTISTWDPDLFEWNESSSYEPKDVLDARRHLVLMIAEGLQAIGIDAEADEDRGVVNVKVGKFTAEVSPRQIREDRG